MSNTFKKMLLALFAILFPGLGDKGGILMYHSIGSNGLFFTTKVEEFKKQMEFLKRKNLNVIPLAEMCQKIKHRENISNCISITFDDGYADFIENALPILEKNKFPATVFLIPSKIGGSINSTSSEISLRTMSQAEIKSILANNALIDFMPHTMTHPDLNKIEFEDALKEINDSRKEVELITAKPGDIFAYPRGKYTLEIADHIRNSGSWLGAVTVETGLIGKDDDLFTIKRIPVDSATSFPVFKRKLSRGIDLYQRLKSRK